MQNQQTKFYSHGIRIPRLKQEFKDRVVAALSEEFGYKNVMQVPKLNKIVVSRGVGAAVADKKLLKMHVKSLPYHRSKSDYYNV